MRTSSVLGLLLLALVSFQRNANASDSLLGSKKVTKLHFYLHDTLSGKDPGDVLVAHGANANPKPGNPAPFSSVFVTDDVLTEGPERTSKVVGSAQGLYFSTGKAEPSLVMGTDFALADYKNSSFSVFSRNPVTRKDGIELSIVGGRGAFRMARGYALLRTHKFDVSTGDAVVEYNVTLLHH
ncbi:dirigent protein 15 [Brachypodium distachyon]|uniref:Dirigent protein n=1 Tax=Brachypodium distachyon TaxID=15368 RepID=I1GLT0_BRADI|nr:dirigent protein 15 [Brachypodium distachyon]KQK12540.1 hypothetical protein BRADI_1g04370v3 [Brachypodium distachyon]|eukprot:XP_003559258.1 dirigent protein 15 [Brachypodium distachyon]